MTLYLQLVWFLYIEHWLSSNLLLAYLMEVNPEMRFGHMLLNKCSYHVFPLNIFVTGEDFKF